MINVQKKNITPAQILILVWAGVLVLAVVLFVGVVYRPAVERMLDEKAVVDRLGDHLRWVTHVIDSYPDPQQVFDYFAESERSLGWRFPDAEQKSLLAITEYAHKFQIRIEQVQTGSPEKVIDPRGEPVSVEGETCKGVRVRVKFKAEYQNLIKYIETLRKVLPAYPVIEDLEIHNGVTTVPKLSGTLGLVLYILE